MSIFNLLDRVGVVVSLECRVLVGELMAEGKSDSYEVTGISPQSITLPQKLKGFAAMGLRKTVSRICNLSER